MPDIVAVSGLLGVPVLSVRPLAAQNGGCHSSVFVVETERRDYILRIPRGVQGFHTIYVQERIPLPDWFDQRWAMDRARGLGVPAPEIVYSGRSACEAERFVIMSKLSGQELTDYECWNGCPYDECEFGLILSKLHSIVPSGYGPIDDMGRTYFVSWSEFLLATAQGMLDICESRKSLGEADLRKLRRKWLPRLSQLEMDKPALLHMESLGFANILYESERRQITGFLDFEDCIGGDPLYELEWMCYYYGARESQQAHFDYGRFEEGYGVWPVNPERSLLYRPLMFLEKLTWIDPNSERAHDHRCRISQCVDLL